MSSWRIIDSIALNLHLLVAFYTIYLCIDWQLSLFTCFYLMCIVLLVTRASRLLYKNSQDFDDGSNKFSESFKDKEFE